MNAAKERTRSLWMDVAMPGASRLQANAACDVVVVGAGMAGLSTAYELAALGKSVIVVDRGAIAGGMTARTTAHLSFEIDDFNDKLIGRRGKDVARQYFESQKAAVDRIEQIAEKESIDCDFARVDGFFVPAGKDAHEQLEKEHEAVKKIGFTGVTRGAPPTGYDGPALRFPNQARFHPLKYLSGLVAALKDRGVKIYANTPIIELHEKDGRVIAKTEDGFEIQATIGVSATNSPINDLVAIHTKQAPYRTYAIAAHVPKGSIEDILVWDTLDPYHYVRIQPGDSQDFLIVGGEDHKSGLEDDGAARTAHLEQWARHHYPQMGELAFAWSGQVYEPIDYVGHIGTNPGDKNIYVISGDSGQGITTAVAGALILADLVSKDASPWEEAYKPSRKTLTATGTYLGQNVDVVANLTEYLRGAELKSTDDLAPDSGGILRQHGHPVAAYRDKQGDLHLVSATCTHVGCLVHFNSFERCWDCPCHGSQFSVDGEVLAGPAKKALKPVET